MTDKVSNKCAGELRNDQMNREALSGKSQTIGSVSDFEMSPELKELLDNTPILADEDVAELGEANRKLGLPWWKRLFETLKQNKEISRRPKTHESS